MATTDAFNSVVAARTRTAEEILGKPDKLKLYEDRGGLVSDLEEVRDYGHQAEALNQAQSAAQAAGGGATLSLLSDFVGLQKDYRAVMAVVQAVRRDLSKAKAQPEVIAAVDKILVNEAEVKIREIKQKAAVGAAKATPSEAKAKKAAVKSASQEALRAEIQKDATSLIALLPVHKALAKRKVDKARLQKLEKDAQALSDKLADRVTKKGGAKKATAEERVAVAEQKHVWAACYRILAAVGRVDHGVHMLLAEASAK